MNLYSGLAGEALELVREHQSTLDRLPRTFLVSILLELERWLTLFKPERLYYRALLKQLATLPELELDSLFTGLTRLESQAKCHQVEAATPKTFQERTLNLLRKEGLYSSWRQEIDAVFQKLQPTLEAHLYSGDTEPRLIVILYGSGISIQRDKLWKRFSAIGSRIPLHLNGSHRSEAFLRTLFTGHSSEADQTIRPTLFHILQKSRKVGPLDAWIVEAGNALQVLCERNTEKGNGSDCATGMSYDRLQGYREQLTKALYSKILSGVPGPLELAAYAKGLKIMPQEGISLYCDDVVLAFIRDIFLGGNGTLIMNNSFVEWAAVQSIKRAQPHVLVVRFGVRDKMKPFNSLLLFSKARPADQIPILQEPLGSFIDVELLSYYIWLNAEKGPPYREKTLYLLLAEGTDEMLAVLPNSRKLASDLPAATLPDVAVTMAQWLGLSLSGSPGQVIGPLVSS